MASSLPTTPSKKSTNGDTNGLFNLSTTSLTNHSSSSFISSSTSSSIRQSSPIKKLHFDDRSRTKTSLALRSYKKSSFSTLNLVNNNLNHHQPIDQEPLHGVFKWNETTDISDIISSMGFVDNHGPVVDMAATAIHLGLATEKGRVVIFNYHQEIECVLIVEVEEEERHERTRSSAGGGGGGGSGEVEISCMSFSADSTMLAAGYKNGQIRLWDLNSKKVTMGTGGIPSILPYFVIQPISLSGRFTKNFQGHIIDCKITNISFINDSNSQLISTDESGLVFYHNGIKKFMNKYFSCSKILGKNDANLSTNTDNGDDRFSILTSEMLPLGSSHQITDKMGILAILTPKLLTIVSTISLNDSHIPNVIQHFKIGRSKHVNITPNGLVGSLSWCPCMESQNGKIIKNAKIAYSWNNVLTIIELNNQSFPPNFISVINELKNKDKSVPKLPFKKTSRWISPHPSDVIQSTKWISSDILTIFLSQQSQTTTMISFYYDGKSLTPVGQDPIQINIHRLVSFKNRLLAFTLLPERKIFMGRQMSWADIISTKLSQGNYADALETVYEYYTTMERSSNGSASDGKLILVGLDKDQTRRQGLVEPYLEQIMRESIGYLFSRDRGKEERREYLGVYFRIVSLIAPKGFDILEEVFEKLEEEGEEEDEEFFGVLEPFILTNSIKALPALLLKRLVEYYIQANKGELLTDMLCMMDIESLDIDLTIQLCEQYNLRDCLIYIWNYLLHDYETPLIDFLSDILQPDEEFIQSEEYLKAYTYMSYILTGRQYPTDRFIEPKYESEAKTKICDILFSNTSISRNGHSVPCIKQSTIFPYLYTFLKINSFEMLSTMNEFFEDPHLNDDSQRLNRQYLTEALIDLYDSNERDLSDQDRCQLAIFVGRNYPKYSQFIRLSESILTKIINTLCECNEGEEYSQDCELALSSLLPHYAPDIGEDFLIEKLTLAKYYNVLIGIYKSKGQYSNALEIWIKKLNEENSNDENIREEYESSSGGDSLLTMVEQSFLGSRNANDRLVLISVIKNNFMVFVRLDIGNFVSLVDKYCPQLHFQVFELNDDVMEFAYLKELFDGKKKVCRDYIPFVGKYIEVLAMFDSPAVFQFVQNWQSILIDDENEFNKCIDVLRSKELVDSQASLLVLKGDYLEAETSILDYMKKIAPKLEDNQSIRDKFEQILSYLVNICELPQTYTILIESDFSLNEKMWLDVIHNLVEMANNTKKLTTHDFINKCIHDCFRTISDYKLNSIHIGDQKEKSFLVIFNRFLQEYSQESKIATLSNIRGILQEVFISYSYESEMLKISLRMLNKDIYKNTILIKGNKLRGWNIKAKICSSCGKLMWGGNGSSTIMDDHILAWEDRERRHLLLVTEQMKEEDSRQVFHSCELIFFMCGHGYHLKCLESLGIKHKKYCLICLPNN
ncbi:VPS8 [[Candida] subhashii]|uniref:VPS8 n=1 Tax=[Candida] subhashii TaxID=561895 RepID=A0A8J5QF86_9ASCO|nr:VPS8 [[Candida] subhashii]KAG7660458.1 VPS8 [[Candida] subhashii]